MRRQVGGILAAVVAVGPLPAALAGPAGARTTGRESFRGVIVAPSKSGRRTVVSSLLVARGIFTAVGRIVEVPNRPGDPDSVVRDDLVFASGRIDIRSTSGRVSMSLNPQTCAFTVRAQQTVRVQGGTGRFRHASGRLAGPVRARGVAARDADGSCSQHQAPLLDVDVLTARGRLSI
jgi:hypothetical protein